MRVRVSIDEMACISFLRVACFHNGHCHNDIWQFGLRRILGRAVRIRPTEAMDFDVVERMEETSTF